MNSVRFLLKDRVILVSVVSMTALLGYVMVNLLRFGNYPYPIENLGLQFLNDAVTIAFFITLVIFVFMSVADPVMSFFLLVGGVYAVFFFRYSYGLIVSTPQAALPPDAFTGNTLWESLGTGIQLSTPQDLFAMIWAVLAGPRFVTTMLLRGASMRHLRDTGRLYLLWLLSGLVSVVFSQDVQRSVTIFYAGFVAPSIMFFGLTFWFAAVSAKDEVINRVKSVMLLFSTGVGCVAAYSLFRTLHGYLFVYGDIFNSIRLVRGGFLATPPLMLLALAVAISLYPTLTKRWERVLCYSSIGLLLFSILVGLSRTLVASVPVMVGMLVMARRLRFPVFVGSGIVVLLILVFGLSAVLTDRIPPLILTQDISSALADLYQDRLQLLQLQFRAFQEAPLVGIGLGAMAEHFYRSVISIGFYLDNVNHAMLPSIAAELGLLGIVAFGVLLLAGARNCLRVILSSSRKSDENVLAFGLLAGVIVYMVQANLSAGPVYATGALQLQSNAYALATVFALQFALGRFRSVNIGEGIP